MTSSPPIACTLTDARQRERQQQLQQRLSPMVREMVELEDGYALRFPGEPGSVRGLAELIVFERACCPFLSLELVAEAEEGPVWLKLRGPAGTKAFLEQSFELCKRASSERRVSADPG